MHKHKNLKILDHPLIQHKLAHLRDHRTGSKSFRELLHEISSLMAYELTRNMVLEPKEVQTPIAKTSCQVLVGKKISLVPILRAGLGMIDGFLKIMPVAKVGHIGLYRDPKTMQSVHYYSKLPLDIKERDFIIIDPMLATGVSAVAAIKILIDQGAPNIKLMCLVAAPEGVKKVFEQCPDVTIYTASLDECLNDLGYIVPGLGDAGDRLFGTQ